jgi:S-adenosylmethionine-dependent methyltransferase
MDVTGVIRDYYDASVEAEWARIENRPEERITRRFIERYIKPGERALDIGGGPGRYALWLAEAGCEVTLYDLSPENVRFAREKAAARGLSIQAMAGDAREVDARVDGAFDHILLMGPMYHLLEARDRVRAVEASLKLLKPGGLLYVSFINVFAGMIYAMKFAPEIILDESESEFYQTVLADASYAGQAFTQAYFIHQREVLPFMAQFPLEKLHFIGQEGITSPCEGNIMSQPTEIADAWIDMAVKLAEREDLLSWSEHLMYIGRKKG